MPGRPPLEVSEGLRWLSEGPPGIDEIEAGSGLGPEFSPEWINFGLSRWAARHAWVAALSFAIPCREAIAAIAGPGVPILEVGAATGFWAALVARTGVDVVATDAWLASRYSQPVARFHPIAQMKADEAVRAHADRDVLCVWPEYERGWCAEAVEAMAVGRTIHLVGEGPGGCTGDDRLFDVLDERLRMTSSTRIPTWPGIHDRLESYIKER